MTQRQCLTIDTREINNLGPAKFRTRADKLDKICYYNRNKKDTIFNSFMDLRKETSSSASKIKFSIVKAIDKTNRHDTIYSEISDKLSDFKNDIL